MAGAREGQPTAAVRPVAGAGVIGARAKLASGRILGGWSRAALAVAVALLATPVAAEEQRAFPSLPWFKSKPSGGTDRPPPPQRRQSEVPDETEPDSRSVRSRTERPIDAFPPLSPPKEAVERRELAPVVADDGTGLPHDLWRGLSVPDVEKLLAGLAMPPRSPALHDLWRRLIVSRAPDPPGGRTPSHFLALRLEALYRSGLVDEIVRYNAEDAGSETDPVRAVQHAKALLASDRLSDACMRVRKAHYEGAEVPRPVARDAILLLALCSAGEANLPAASLTLEAAREQSLEVDFAAAIIEHLNRSTIPLANIALPNEVAIIDYAFLMLAMKPGVTPPRVVERAEPALVAKLALGPAPVLEAAEEAARLNAITPAALGRIYLAVRIGEAELAGNALARLDPPRRRAALLQAVRRETSPARKASLMRAFLDQARMQALYLPAARILHDDLKQLAPEDAAFAETAIEIALAAGDLTRAAGQIRLAAQGDRTGQAGSLDHWLMLIEIAGGRSAEPSPAALKTTVDHALKGRFAPDLLHRLVTVLDALEYDVPVPLWEAASRAPQPSKGHLPETGVLAHLKSAVADKRYGASVLLAMRALGPDGAEGAHLIALGDAIRALKVIGLEADARRLALEALFASWPRQVVR